MIIKVLSATRCCAKAIIDAAAVKFRFGAVKFADKKVNITRFHFGVPSDSVNLFVIVARERKAVNPLRPNSDQSQTSHCNITGLSVSEVMRIENMIIQVKFY